MTAKVSKKNSFSTLSYQVLWLGSGIRPPRTIPLGPEFCDFAKAHPEKRFLVTEIGCGIAGYSIGDVAPLFECCIEVENITLPASFWDILS